MRTVKARRTTPVIDRLIARRTLDSDTGCWLWGGYLDKDGYGMIGIGIGGGAKTIRVHQASWLEHRGDLPTYPLVLDHECRVRRCFNPDHLKIKTQRDNVMSSPDSIPSRNASKTHCVHGHEFTELNTRITPAGARRCLKCQVDRPWETQLKPKRKRK